MQPRDVFDGILVSLWILLLYLELIGIGISWEAVNTVKEGVTGLGIAVYLVVGGIFGIAFVGYMFLYLPSKLSQNPSDGPSQSR